MAVVVTLHSSHLHKHPLPPKPQSLPTVQTRWSLGTHLLIHSPWLCNYVTPQLPLDISTSTTTSRLASHQTHKNRPLSEATRFIPIAFHTSVHLLLGGKK